MDIEQQRKLADVSTEKSTKKKNINSSSKNPQASEEEKAKSITVVQKTVQAVITIGGGSFKVVLDPKFGNIAIIVICFFGLGFITGSLTNSETLEKSGILAHIEQIIASVTLLITGLVASISNFLKQKVQKKISQGIDPENTIETNLVN